METRIETSDGLRLHAEAHGEGRAVLLSPGFCQTAENFRGQVEPLVAYDQQGVRSSEPRPISYVRELADTVLISEGAARQLRDVLNAYFAEQSSEVLN